MTGRVSTPIWKRGLVSQNHEPTGVGTKKKPKLWQKPEGPSYNLRGQKTEEVHMQYQVLVENVADEMFSATVLGVPDCVAEGSTEEEALNNATSLLKARLAKGDLFKIEVDELSSPVSANPWLEVNGSLRDDPTFDDFMAEISNNRQENDTGESEQ